MDLAYLLLTGSLSGLLSVLAHSILGTAIGSLRRPAVAVAYRTDEQQMLRTRFGEQRLDQVQSRRIGPLQVVENEHQRLRRRRGCGEKTLQQTAEAVLRLGRAE